MGRLIFYLAVVAACLLWSAAFTAAAARSRPGWIRWLLIAVAVAVPPLALTPWVWFTGGLAAIGLQTNWFAPTLTACLSAVIGGAWIGCAGLSPRAAPVAATWPLVGLAAMFVLAKAVAAGTLLFIDNAVAAEGRMLRVEAAQIISNALPPAPSAEDNAAPLYQRAFTAVALDKEVDELVTADVASDEVTAMLERHAAALELLRRATDKPGCRFDRDWSRPSIDMLLPEVQAMRRAARLLTLAARRAAADRRRRRRAGAGRRRPHPPARDARCQRTDPRQRPRRAGDRRRRETLADVLPQLEKSDLPLLEKESLRDFVATPIRFQRAFLGEEAFGLATLADLADGARETSSMELLRSIADEAKTYAFDAPLSLLYRCFLLPADITGYRAIIHRYQSLFAALASPTPKPFAALQHEAAAIEEDLKARQAGIFSALMAPALASVLTSQSKGEALHEVAGVLVAATHARLRGKPLGQSLVPEAVPALPDDPFRAEGPLTVKTGADGWLVYSVGPDGEDDGGPVPAGAEPVEGNDDVGLRLAF